MPDGKENNRRLALYTAAMKKVATEQKVSFVDLFTPTKSAYDTTKAPLTINGVHLDAEGNAVVAGIIGNALFGVSAEPKLDAKTLEALRKAVVEKNEMWFGSATARPTATRSTAAAPACHSSRGRPTAR